MREIKFRCWDKTHRDIRMSHNFMIDSFDGTLYWQFGFDELKFLQQDNFVLMQYTGLKDKNGKEIYFQDLLRDKNNNIWRVDEMKNSTGYGITCITDTGSHDELYPRHMSLGLLVMGKHEIIGNIYENPELVEKK